MTKPLSDQVVVIVGASSGMGRATALLMAARGARVVAVARNAGALDSLVDEIGRGGGEALAIPADATNEADLRGVVRRTEERFGRIDTWINNASVYIQGRVQDIELDEYRRIIDVNLVGAINGTRCALEPMLRQGGGTIILTSSILGLHGAPYTSAYAAAKSGIDGFVEALRGELWGSGVKVAVVYPPTVDTPIYRSARGKFGTVPLPPPPVVSPETAARVFAEVAERPRRARTFGVLGHTYPRMARALPAPATDALLHRLLQYTVGSEPTGPDNLDAPLHKPRARDGWIERRWRGLTLRQLVQTFPQESAVAGAALALLAAGVARRLARRG
ncbi:MAG: SDR family NAD(P)-dependent oxidoreductase [Gemmatimonadetes bacterium]|nr:SDR family NAD(P)-dependent oxidoreductase [Gemmatimonadota bacterium]